MDPNVGAPRGFSATSGLKLLTTPSCNNAMFSMNTQVPPWNDVHVRRAAAYAINRAAIVTAFGGYSAPLYTVIPPVQLRTIASAAQVSSLLASVPLYKYSLADAKQQMAESAYPHGVTATMLGDNYSSDTNVDEVIAAELGAVGIHVQLKVVPYANWLADLSGPDLKRMTTYTGWNECNSPDPSSYMDWFGSSNLQIGQYNTADYAPPQVDKLIAAGVATTAPAKRFAVYAKLVQRLQVDEPYVALFVTDVVLGLSAKFIYPGFGPFYWLGDYALPIRRAT